MQTDTPAWHVDRSTTEPSESDANMLSALGINASQFHTNGFPRLYGLPSIFLDLPPDEVELRKSPNTTKARPDAFTNAVKSRFDADL